MTHLEAPPTYFGASDEQRAAVTNGCGPACWKHDLGQNRPMGISLAGACNIHDWMYFEGHTERDRVAADELFWVNLKTLIRNAGGPLKPFRWVIGWMYWRGVTRAGGLFFDYVPEAKAKTRR